MPSILLILAARRNARRWALPTEKGLPNVRDRGSGRGLSDPRGRSDTTRFETLLLARACGDGADGVAGVFPDAVCVAARRPSPPLAAAVTVSAALFRCWGPLADEALIACCR